MHLAVVFGSLLLLFTAIYFYANKQFQTPILFPVLFFLVSFCIGLGAITLKNELNNKKHYSNQLQFSDSIPAVALISIDGVLKSTAYYDKYEAEVTQLNGKKSIHMVLIIKNTCNCNKFTIKFMGTIPNF
jgi:competence protein ComEC